MPQLDDDTQGNILGERATFIYTTNDGTVYNMTQDASVGEAVGNTLSLNAANPVIKVSQSRPIKPRYVLLEGATAPEKRKRVIIGSATNPLITGGQLTATINGESYRVTTQVGERESRLRVNPPPAG